MNAERQADKHSNILIERRYFTRGTLTDNHYIARDLSAHRPLYLSITVCCPSHVARTRRAERNSRSASFGMRARAGGLDGGDDCYNTLTSTNYELFEFEHVSHESSSLSLFRSGYRRFVGPFFRANYERAAVRKEKTRRRLFAELSASFKVHESAGKIGSAQSL